MRGACAKLSLRKRVLDGSDMEEGNEGRVRERVRERGKRGGCKWVE